ncbi:MAG: hypothetical protein EPN36_02175 [Rhodanobacteraceae bacterium]|nr:MAG: hypothetical protein EPN36_02175 [Rhodanobacteraceae bacterium]
MTAQTASLQRPSRARRRVALAILAGGLIAGTLDIGAAALNNRVDPRLILHFIAGGVQGAAALHGGAASAWLGLFLQWGMSLVIAAVFVLAALRLRWLTARPVLAGLAYGVVIFVVMNYGVMFFSAWHRINHFTPEKFAMNLVAMLVFGLIVAFCTRWLLGVVPRRP